MGESQINARLSRVQVQLLALGWYELMCCLESVTYVVTGPAFISDNGPLFSDVFMLPESAL